ncbi:hypothetical protein ACNQR7_32705 [Mycolicibacterium senegalense]|uniref:hypothetical protein n=1 Tax=Mycolicibacterium senegalense TaxID=1796 RepID=UPI003AAD10BD
MELAPNSRRPSTASGAGFDEDLAAARRYAREVKIAADEWHDNPFSESARAKVLKLIVVDSDEADASWLRAIARHDASL